MQNTSPFNHPYLNRLALATDDDGSDPYSIIKDFFYSGSISDMKELLMEACRAGLSEKYRWKEGSPGNLLYFYERLETLVEVCFLISIRRKTKNKLSKKIKRAAKKELLHTVCLPCSLSTAEISNPFLVIHSFFELYTIKKWKQHLYTWMEAGLSNYTVLDSIKAKDILPYHHHLQKLMDACWYINLQVKKEQN
jgi:hypothetical protein